MTKIRKHKGARLTVTFPDKIASHFSIVAQTFLSCLPVDSTMIPAKFKRKNAEHSSY